MGRACVKRSGNKPAAGPWQSRPRSYFLLGRKWASTGTCAWVGRVSRACSNSTLALPGETRLNLRQNDQSGSWEAAQWRRIKSRKQSIAPKATFASHGPDAQLVRFARTPTWGSAKRHPALSSFAVVHRNPVGKMGQIKKETQEACGHQGTSQTLAGTTTSRAHSDHPQQGKRQIGSQQVRLKLSF